MSWRLPYAWLPRAQPIDPGVRIAPVGAKTMRAPYVRRSVACGLAIARRRRRRAVVDPWLGDSGPFSRNAQVGVSRPWDRLGTARADARRGRVRASLTFSVSHAGAAAPWLGHCPSSRASSLAGERSDWRSLRGSGRGGVVAVAERCGIPAPRKVVITDAGTASKGDRLGFSGSPGRDYTISAEHRQGGC